MFHVRNLFLLMALWKQLETPLNPLKCLRESKKRGLVTEYSLFTNGETTGRRRKRWDREKSLTKKRNTLSNDSKHWSKLQMTDCVQNRLKARYSPWAVCFAEVSVFQNSTISTIRLRVNDELYRIWKEALLFKSRQHAREIGTYFYNDFARLPF